MEMLLQGVITGIAVGSIYGLSALGFVIIYKSTGILNVAQGGLVMLGSFLCYTFSVTIGLPLWLSFIAAMASAFLLGLIIDRLLFRPMIGQPLLGVVMMTIALLSIIEGMTTLIWSVNYYSYPEVFPETPIEIGDIILSHEYVWAIGICLFFFLLFGLFFRYTRIGLKMRAVSEDQQAAQAAGVVCEDSLFTLLGYRDGSCRSGRHYPGAHFNGLFWTQLYWSEGPPCCHFGWAGIPSWSHLGRAYHRCSGKYGRYISRALYVGSEGCGAIRRADDHTSDQTPWSIWIKKN